MSLSLLLFLNLLLMLCLYLSLSHFFNSHFLSYFIKPPQTTIGILPLFLEDGLLVTASVLCSSSSVYGSILRSALMHATVYKG